MRKQDYILALIGTMNEAEKRFFKQFATLRPGEKDYLRLFDALENKQRYEADALCKELGVTSTQLMELKRYLIQVLLKSIRTYKDGANENFILTSLSEAEELNKRGLNEHALEIIDKAITIARKDESLYYLPLLIQIKTKTLQQAGYYSQASDLQAEFEFAQRVVTEHYDTAMLFNQIVQFEQNRKTPGKVAPPKHHLLNLKPEDLLSNRARINWFMAMNMYYIGLQDVDKMLQMTHMETAFFEKNKDMLNFAPMQYFVSQIRVVTTEMHSRNFEKAWRQNEKVFKLLALHAKKLPPAEAEKMHLFSQYGRAAVAFQLSRYKDAVGFSEKAYATRHLQLPYIGYTIIFDYACALLHTNQTEVAIEKLDEMLQLNADTRADLQLMVRPLTILAHLHIGNYSLVPYLIKSARSWMKRNNNNTDEAALFLSLAYTIATVAPSQRKQAWMGLYEAAKTDKLKKINTHAHLQRWLTDIQKVNVDK